MNKYIIKAIETAYTTAVAEQTQIDALIAESLKQFPKQKDYDDAEKFFLARANSLKEHTEGRFAPEEIRKLYDRKYDLQEEIGVLGVEIANMKRGRR